MSIRRVSGPDIKHSQIYIDNLKEFLESADWQEQLSMFVDANCDKFHNVTDYMLEHHKIWQDFISIAESVREKS